ncbi:TonB-dependent receptor [Parahaliea mediterranea]|uniref:TonB-dependent receptor n=1 Tax=Parahaliea mediterranea TaxID=651086 RepID=A0A939DHP9_9GAMM|nr:TonB-dependent receptor [Parahaliea mediterranea]MBN7798530.1 TonB-dependent receptor [Parahaliea mediterranea]
MSYQPVKSLLGVAIATVVAGGAQAQHLQLEEVVVTAQKRVESLQDVPISVSAISGQKMEDASITNLESLTTYIPNFSMNQGTIANNITIRGVSSGVNPGFEQSTGMYVDGIYYGRSQLSRLPLFDMERVEVLRGPQPILFGKNSIAGAVNMTTASPGEEFEGQISALYEFEEEQQDYRAVFSGPLTDTLSGRIAMLYRDQEGSFTNFNSSHNEKQEEETVIRGSLRWMPTDLLTMDLKYEHAEFDDVGRNVELAQSIVREDLAGTGAGVDYVTALNNFVGLVNNTLMLEPPVDFAGEDGELNRVRGSNGDYHNNTADVLVLDIDYAFGEYTLTSTTGYLEYDFEQNCDCDFTGASILNAGQDESFEQFSQELRITSPGNETVDYIAGVFYQTNELDFRDSINVPDNSLLRLLNPNFRNISSRRFAQQESDMWAVFAQATWNVSDRLRLVFGARYTEEDKEATKQQVHYGGNTAFPATDPTGTLPNVYFGLNPLFGAFAVEPYDTIRSDRQEEAFTPLFTVQYDLGEDAMVYATYTEGFKAGGFDIRSNGHPDPSVVNACNLDTSTNPPACADDIVGVFDFDEEEAESIEVGAKVGLGGVAELNMAAFYTEYTNLQTSQFDGILGFNVTNAGKAEIQGLELDGRWLVAEGLTLSGAVAWLDFEYTDFKNNQCYFGQQVLEPGSVQPDGVTCDATGKRKEYTPEYSGTLSADYVISFGNNLELRTVLDLVFSDDYLFTPTLDPRNKQDAYTKWNLRVALSDVAGNWELAFIGKNLSDEDVVTFGGDAPLAGALTGGTGTAYYQFLDRPRTFALQALYRF